MVPLLQFNENGIFCEQAGLYLDPWKPVKKAIITHGHSDHARSGHSHYLTHHNNIPVIRHRLGKINVEGKSWGKSFAMNGVNFTLFPAGHIPGSSQVLVEYKGEKWVFTGDYKREDDGLAEPFEPVQCHNLITECTFGLPVFNWLPQQQVSTEINDWWKENRKDGKVSVLFAYTLGKAQRILNHLDTSIGKVYTHGAVENMNDVLRQIYKLPETQRITPETTKKELDGAFVIAPPSAHGSTWMRRLTPFVSGTASGWMAIRGNRRRRAVDRGFVMSDHADWKGILQTIEDTGAERVFCTHGYSELLVRYLRENGMEAYVESTDYSGETDDSSTENAD